MRLAMGGTSSSRSASAARFDVLLPAAMTLLGDRNWWLPRRLGWLPQVTVEPEVQPARA
jgi:hypothetical protein